MKQNLLNIFKKRTPLPFRASAAENGHSFLPVFNNAWIFPDRREISADNCTAHPVHFQEKKIGTFWKLFCFEGSNVPYWFWNKNTFFELILKIYSEQFFGFLLWKPNRSYFVLHIDNRKSWKNDFKFFLTVYFHVFSKIFVTFDTIT
jgi:hypothetical protein